MSATETTPTASPSSTGGGGCSAQTSLACSMPGTGTLYLLTFVGTLVILLVIATLMIARGAYRRRRLQALGLWPPPAHQIRVGIRRKDTFSSRTPPKLWDVYIDPEKVGSTEGTWDGVMPFSAVSLSPHIDAMQAADAKPSDLEAQTDSNAFQPTRGPGSRVALLQRVRQLFRPPAPAPASLTTSETTPNVIPNMNTNTVPLEITQPPPPPLQPTTARLSCVIAMPVPPDLAPSALVSEDGDPYVPLVELGVVDVEIQGVESAGEQVLDPPVADAANERDPGAATIGT